ncbi:MAG: hypothetical protein ACP5OG_05335 [Candidatus Nanoarchaeia archaeon]
MVKKTKNIKQKRNPPLYIIIWNIILPGLGNLMLRKFNKGAMQIIMFLVGIFIGSFVSMIAYYPGLAIVIFSIIAPMIWAFVTSTK